MLLTHQRRQAERGELNMAAMIDVIFLLLVFFMCTSSFNARERVLPSQLPQLGPGDGPVQEDFEPIRIRVEGGSPTVYVCDGHPCLGNEELLRRLEALREINDFAVIIEGQRQVSFKHMVAALDACQQVELTRVAFSANEL